MIPNPPVKQIPVKVCGITRYDQAVQLADLGASFAGFIFYPKSKRYAPRHLTTAQIHDLKNINKVGVFVNDNYEDVRAMVDECRLQVVQLHGDETPRLCERLAEYVTTIKVFRIAPGDNMEWKLKPYYGSCDMFLFDTPTAAFGGSGKKFDWSVFNQFSIKIPWMLSGGIGPTDLETLQKFVQLPAADNLFALDVNSRFETSPGVKDMQLLANFLSKWNNTSKC